MKNDFHKSAYYINRELSWLAFNERVLGEAEDPSQPLLERVKFLSIFSSNLDEFFEIRVAGIKQQIENEVSDLGPDGMGASQLFQAIQKRAHELVERQYALWNEELLPKLAGEGIHLHLAENLTGDREEWAKKFFLKEVFPVLTPLAVDPSHPFPQLLNKSHNLIVLLERPHADQERLHGVVQIPRVLPRLIRLPDDEKGQLHFLYLKGLIRRHLAMLFPGMKVRSAHAFRITRNSDLYVDEEEADNLLRTIEEELRKRNRGNAVRLEVEDDCPDEVVDYLLHLYRLKPEDLYRAPGPLTFLHVQPLYSLDDFPHLRDKPFYPATSLALPHDADLYGVLRRGDVLLHHPYENFASVVEFIEHSANDPSVLAIKMTLYRTSGDSPVVKALGRAAENGKQVTVLVELKARGDEANNINWARKLEEAGAHVVYGVVGLKTHCKLLLVVRRDKDGIRLYSHLGTGNYNSTTARFYTDLGLMTTRTELTSEVARLFNILTGMCEFGGINHLLVAPYNLSSKFIKLIDAEAERARKGGPAKIIIKVNSLVDEEMIAKLYEASAAGVKVECIVRGICCLRPGIPGVSENIRVISIIGRFLEHSRIFYFENGGNPKVFMGSADWMPRNLHRRVEVIFPILSEPVRKRVLQEILPTFLNDCGKAHQLNSDGTYEKLHPEPGKEPFQAQLTFRKLAREERLRELGERNEASG